MFEIIYLIIVIPLLVYIGFLPIIMSNNKKKKLDK